MSTAHPDDHKEYQQCPSCLGELPKRFECRRCNGNGYVLKITSKLLQHAGRTVLDAIERAKRERGERAE